jgi:CubicO group peptidase (beta-lactamase class C family)
MAGAPEQLVDDMPDLMARASVPGVSIAFVRDRHLAWSAGFGTTRRETGRAIGQESIFQAASLSKPVFAYAVLWMVYQRVLDLDLDRSLADYLPERFVADDDMLEHVTARHVLAHTTGWPNWRPKGEPLRREAVPGERFGYSGEGYFYLQRVVEHMTGESLESLMQARVLRPLGMQHSSYARPDRPRAQIAVGHDREGLPLDQAPNESSNAAYSLHATACDLATFMAAILAGGAEPASPTAEMLEPQVRVNERVTWGLRPRLASS